jgi:hypothetical protein
LGKPIAWDRIDSTTYGRGMSGSRKIIVSVIAVLVVLFVALFAIAPLFSVGSP